jgi:N-acetylglucosamine-6-sulfatase
MAIPHSGGGTRRRLRNRALLIPAVLCAVIGAVAVQVASGPTSRAAAAQGARPNILVVMTDDQAAASMKVMGRVRARLGDHGTTFKNSYVNTPLCCPSRATYLTGQYAHNHGVRGNNGHLSGFKKFQANHGENNLATWLKSSGYATGYVGKYLNGYGAGDPTFVPAGWDEWRVAGPSARQAYDYKLNENGSLVRYGRSKEAFKQDVLTDHAVKFINANAPAADPFFLSVGYSAPHQGGPEPNPRPPANCKRTAKPAPRHAHAFDSVPLPKPPSFNEADVSDKPPSIRAQTRFDGKAKARITRRFRCRLESLLSVDEGVARMIAALADTGELDATLIVFTSDNGFFHGEHRYPDGKGKHYEEASRVPLIIRGPGFPADATERTPSVNADLTATILDAANIEPGLPADGVSLLPISGDGTAELDREILIENKAYRAIRSNRYVYVEHNGGEDAGFRELYDVEADPWELESLHANPAYEEVQSFLRDRLARLATCAGASCRQIESAGSSPPPTPPSPAPASTPES